MNIALPDGSVKELAAGATVADVAASIGAGLAKAALAGKVDGTLVDLTATVTDGATVEIITAKSPEALHIMRHSCAHIMAEAVQELYPGTQIAFGPATDDGYFYDFELPNNISSDDFGAIEKKMAEIVKADEPFVREVVSIDEAKKIFADQRFKLEHIDDLTDQEISIYRHGSFVDLCAGPHVPSAGKIGAFKMMKLAGAYWRGDATREQLQRLYGTAFFKKSELEEYLHNLEEAEKRDHRRIGREMDIFMMRDEAPGFPFFLPNGMIKFDNGLLTGGFLTAVFLFYNSVTGYYMTQGYGRDAENARRDIPKAILLTLPTLVVLYVGVAIAAIGSTSAAEFGESSSLVFAAKNIMPPALFYVFIIGGPMMALLSSLNSSYAYHSITIGQSCKDGWFPEKLATQNKHGAYTYILVFIYLISIVPIVIGFNITQLVNLLQLVTFMTSVIPQIAYLRLPKKYPEAWKNAKLHIPDGLYYLLCVVSIAICVIVFVKSCLSMSRTVVIVSTIGIILCVTLGLWRSGKGNVTIRTSVWDESEEG